MRAYQIGLAASAFAVLLSLASCNTTPKEIPADLTAKEMIQRAQEASDAGKFDAARHYYGTAKSRFPDDMAVVCACEYEIAFLDYKQKRYEAAVDGFSILLARYASPDAAFLPQEYKILAEKVMKKANEVLDAKRAKAEKKKAKAAAK